MDTVPIRTQLARWYRLPLQKIEERLPLFITDPNIYQVIELLLSVVFLFTVNNLQRLIVVILVLVLDWLDGATARRYGLVSKKGYVVDVFIDRLSEGFLFITILDSLAGKLFFTLYLINITLSFYSVKTGKHIVIALRFFYIVFLVAQFFLENQI